MNDLVSIINHPGMPWAGGGIVGGVIGAFALKDDCVRAVAFGECEPALLPIVNVVAGSPLAIAMFTVVGAIVGTAWKKWA